ncbi:MAG: RNA polymerase sigma factor [Phycisphaerae bacterium]
MPGTAPNFENPAEWNRLIDAAGPASLLVAIEHRLSAALRRRLTAEDVLQEALLHAWRDRARVEWRGVRAFRAWLLAIIDNRVRDLADRQGALKRGGNQVDLPLGRGGAPDSQTSADSALLAAVTSTTPSRAAIRVEQAAAMRAALGELPDDCREIVRMRVFEQLPIEQIAAQLQLGVSAARHRFRKGAEQYHRRLRALLAGSISGLGGDRATDS